jgi:hypothetical protein
LLWGEGDGVHVGDPDAPRVWCPCYAATPCPGCGNDDDRPGFALVIEESAISAVFQAPQGFFYPKTPEWVTLVEGERPTAAPDERDVPGRMGEAPAVAPQAALCGLLGLVDHDDEPDGAIKPTDVRILDTVTLMRSRLEILTASDRDTTDLRACIDNQIQAGQNPWRSKRSASGLTAPSRKPSRSSTTGSSSYTSNVPATEHSIRDIVPDPVGPAP